jgi:hypothetical protein
VNSFGSSRQRLTTEARRLRYSSARDDKIGAAKALCVTPVASRCGCFSNLSNVMLAQVGENAPHILERYVAVLAGHRPQSAGGCDGSGV